MGNLNCSKGPETLSLIIIIGSIFGVGCVQGVREGTIGSNIQYNRGLIPWGPAQSVREGFSKILETLGTSAYLMLNL